LGTVKWLNANKGFGFIAPDRGGRDIFAHASALEHAGIAGLAEGPGQRRR
jgi:CspA family cold shock protein